MNKTRELPVEIWDSIFFASNNGLTGSEKVVICKTSPVFEAVLRGKILEECVTHLIPVVAPYLSKRDLLKLRQTCKGLKQGVEELEEIRFGSSILASLEFGDDDQRWSELAGMIEKLGGNSTLGRWLSLAVEPEMELEDDKAAEFFQKCGHRIVNLKLRVAMNCAESLRYRLLQYLKCCGNLRRLQLFPEILSRDLNYSSNLLMGQLFNVPVFERSPDPIQLPFLTELEMCSRILEMAENGESRIERFYEMDFDLFFERLFCSNLGKLTKLEISEAAFCRAFLSEFMPSPSFVTEFKTTFEKQYAVETLRILQSKGAKLKKLTLVDKRDHLATNDNESKAQLFNYLQGAETLRTLSLHFETGVAFFEDFPPLETEINSSVRSLILRNVIFPDGKGLKNLGAFKSLDKFHLNYGRDNNPVKFCLRTSRNMLFENYDFTQDANDILDHVPSIRQVTVKSFNTPTVYSINHQH